MGESEGGQGATGPSRGQVGDECKPHPCLSLSPPSHSSPIPAVHAIPVLIAFKTASENVSISSAMVYTFGVARMP